MGWKQNIFILNLEVGDVMNVLTLIGTRPELIRLSVIIKKLDKIIDHVFVYTNQNYDYNLSGRFFDELKIRKPDYYFTNEGHSIGRFLSNAILQFEDVILKEKPDKMLVLGDTNSGLLSLIANKHNIPIIHMEAGSRCFDNRVPEETNRRVIDSLSTYNLPYTENSKQNLLCEGFNKNFVFKTGNPIYEVLKYYESEIDNSDILNKLNLKEKEFVLVTAHRTENVDNFESLSNIMNAVNKISEQFKVIFSVHPRTKDKMNKFNIVTAKNVIRGKSFGFFDFNKLSKMATLLISDSGSNPEAACLFNVHSIVIRDTTERQELIECGSTVLTGTNYNNIVNAFNVMIKRNNKWIPPDDYLKENVSDTVINILLGR
jgi:UDP-N-acetylglucosamine 2-epimerase (non-hydrolysing)